MWKAPPNLPKGEGYGEDGSEDYVFIFLGEYFSTGHHRSKYDFVLFWLLIKAKKESHLYRITILNFY
jgi:hypothetical protein